MCGVLGRRASEHRGLFVVCCGPMVGGRKCTTDTLTRWRLWREIYRPVSLSKCTSLRVNIITTWSSAGANLERSTKKRHNHHLHGTAWQSTASKDPTPRACGREWTPQAEWEKMNGIFAIHINRFNTTHNL